MMIAMRAAMNTTPATMSTIGNQSNPDVAGTGCSVGEGDGDGVRELVGEGEGVGVFVAVGVGVGDGVGGGVTAVTLITPGAKVIE
jgi:hypothetical protein